MPITHVIRTGECVSSVAALYGFRDCRTVYDDPANAELRKRRPNPNILFEGDRVVIPDKEERLESSATGRQHRFVARSATTFLRVRVDTTRRFDYALVIDDDVSFEGKGDGQSVIVHPIKPSARRASLVLWPSSLAEKTPENGQSIALTLGTLAPIDEVAGVQGRLTNLDFYRGPIDNVLGEPTRAAIREFEVFIGWPPSGELTDALRAQLVARHDG